MKNLLLTGSVRSVRGCLAVLGLVLTSLIASGQDAQAGIFPDKNLEAAVRSQVFEKKDKTDELTEDDCKKVFILEARGKGISSLAGLEKCVNLQLVNFAKNEITDVTPLAGLKSLQSVDLGTNKITDVNPLKDLTSTQYLDLSANQITDAKPLAGLTRLSMLDLTANQIKDLAPLAGLTRLSSLYLGQNQITDLNPLAGITGISTLKLSDNQITDLTPLGKSRDLRMLFIERNKLADLTPLVAACQADAAGDKRFAPFLRLYYEGNPLADPAKNEQLPALAKIGVRLTPKL